MRRLAIGSLAMVSLALTACSNGPIFSAGSAQPPSLTPVSSIVNAIKCELGETFRNGRFLEHFVKTEKGHALVKGTLTLDNVVAGSNAGSAGLEVAPLGVTIGPTGKFTRSRETGQSVALEFSYDIDATTAPPPFCANLAALAPDKQPVLVAGHPFIDLLDGVQKQHAQFQTGAPKVKLGTFTYDSAFKIERATEAGVDIKFLIFAIGASHSRTNSSGQELALEFDLGDAPEVLRDQ